MYRILALDIDGTLTDNRNQLSKENIEYVRKIIAMNIQIVLISGRPYKSMTSIAEELGLEECYIVSMAGSDIRKYPSGECVYSAGMNKLHIVNLFRVALEHGKYLQIFRADGSYYYHSKTKYTEMYEDFCKYSGNQVNFYDVPFTDICKAMFIMDPDGISEFEQTINSLLENTLRIEKIGNLTIDVYSNAADKGTGLRYVANKLRICKNEIISIGDEKVDIPMFRESGFSVAMENSSFEVKKYADAITLTNDNNGVAEAIKHFILLSK